jgi:hypothetical protein
MTRLPFARLHPFGSIAKIPLTLQIGPNEHIHRSTDRRAGAFPQASAEGSGNNSAGWRVAKARAWGSASAVGTGRNDPFN